MMNKQSIFYAIAAVILAVYLGIAGVWASRQARDQVCEGLEGGTVQVLADNTGAHTGFVTPDEMMRQLGTLPQTLASRRLSDINLDSLSRALNALDNLESATVTRLNNNKVKIAVTPLRPLVRVWAADGRSSFYINSAGKKMKASSRFTIDVPQATGKFSPAFGPERLLPLFDFMALHPQWNRLITMVNVRDSNNVILVPAVRGHVINFGSVSSIPSKFDRLRTFYSEVMPVKGWEYYDTISVKWDGQIVATRRKNKLPPPRLEIIEELENEGDTPETMETTQADQTPA